MTRRITFEIAALLTVLTLGPGSRSLSEEEAPPVSQISQELIDKVKVLLLKRAPNGQVINREGAALFFQYNYRGYRSHIIGKPVRYSTHSGELQMPYSDGFEVELDWSIDDYGQSGMSAGGGPYGQVIGTGYYRQYVNFCKLTSIAGYIRLRVEYGTQVDKAFIDLIRAELVTVGEQVYEDESERWRKNALTIQEEMSKAINKSYPQATWSQKD